MNSSEQSTSEPGAFIPTRWTLVLRALGQSPEGRAALGELCQAFYAPVRAFITGTSRNQDSARDLTQEFFARVLSGHGFESVDPDRGRFRSFLLGAVKHFLADQYDRDRAIKRGGGEPAISVEAGVSSNTTAQLQIPDPTGPPPDTFFDREWAQTVVSRALDRLAAEFQQSGKAGQFDTLKHWLVGHVESLSQADAAARLGWTEGAVKVAVHRLRKQFRELVKMEIGQTLNEQSQVDDELRYLVQVLCS